MLTIDVEQEDDGRWIAEVAAIPGVLAYGVSEADARSRAAALACRVIADLIDHGDPVHAPYSAAASSAPNCSAASRA